ncbi:N-acetylglucosamine related transporter, NagX [Formosa agariphila KMM 3901]|uniref:N-acetylglucosamine related transporter, NagX n=1 Tax=Formosa agariphila (strain DSM 15362 / KCTC 12365 / LMG 23005 / KMM 3901 / M-2Alg 35-1) TaxID=1347342 RepID=T2KMP2_FORAG|nr:hypothetical protein [Formosa agariphila]CDF79696.1 N-acetylglucosamine related transporter, NagX [Formosa agariphila KMM 3901]
MKVSNRLISLDVLRGITISLMILVNTPGSWSYVYAPLRHAKWHGCNPTDLVFPFFLFIVGVSVWFSFSKYQTSLSRESALKIIIRTFVIFLLGFVLNLFPFFDFSTVRIMGVLQRIALAYGVGSILCLAFKRNHLLLVLSVILIGYWALLLFGADMEPYALIGNVVREFDIFLFEEEHVYKGFGVPFDPEGVLSTIPAVGTVIIGFFIGQIIDKERVILRKIRKLLIYGSMFVFLGWIWSFIFPINKALWTSSYVLFTSGLCILLLALLIFIIDYKGFSRWSKPFVHFGTNPLFIFVFSGLYVKTISYLIKIHVGESGDTISGYKYMYEHLLVPVFGNMNGSLLFALIHVFVFWLICLVLYKNKIFIKI